IVLRKRHERSEASHPLALLRPPRERPRGRRAAEECDELASPHSITSSAREQLSKNGEAILLRHLGGQWFALFDHKSCNGFYGRCFLVDTFVDFAGFNIE